MNRKNILITLLSGIIFHFIYSLSYGYNCVSDIYQDFSFKQVSKSFLAGDKIYLKISCQQLPPDKYFLVVNWIKDNYGIVRTDKRQFVIKDKADREVFFWMKVGKKGLANRIISLSDYNSDMIGGWNVNSHLNNENIGEHQFTVN